LSDFSDLSVFSVFVPLSADVLLSDLDSAAESFFA